MSDQPSKTEAPSPWGADSADTPLLKQYWELKAQAGDAILLFRMGDFYEVFAEDAIECARILEITLTTRDKNKPNPLPMAGVPFHSIQGYLQKLLRAGKKVAICEQFEEQPAAGGKGKPIVRRAIVRTLTPGIQFDLEGAEANYVACVVTTGAGQGQQMTLACLDVSTGEALVGEPMDAEKLQFEALALPIRHLISLEKAPDLQLQFNDALREALPSNYLSQPQAEELLCSHYEVGSLDAFLPSADAVRALGILVAYAVRTQKLERLAHLRIPAPLRRPKAMVLGPRTPQHLDLVPGTGAEAGGPNVFDLINRTRSALGARQLRRWLLAPLASPAEILERQDGVREIASARESLRERLGARLGEAYDLERISGRVNTGLANPRDTLALGKTLVAFGEVPVLLDSFKAPCLGALATRIRATSEKLRALGERIVREQRDDAPLVTREGGIFNRGVSAELDRLISMSEDGSRWLTELEAREREATGISSLKVRYNRVFGYYIEVTQAHLKNVPAHYQRKQTTVGAERFFTEELKKFEDEIVHASSRQKALEIELFDQLLAAIRAQTPSVMEAARLIGDLDSLAALARVSEEPGWSFPRIDDSMDVVIRAGRHPLVDAASRGKFVPNDLELGSERRSLVITGPNMGGKSTVMRQSALIVILGQIGSAVPAAEARWGAVSSVYTRIGAHDAIARGQSTFMVEMSELAHILHHADARSLIVLDEIGRGTSTYDGISVAWSTLEWICARIQARTLFATHYHELTRLAGELPGLANAHMAVESGSKKSSGSLRFLYELREGPASESFGIHVAAIAGLPKPVVQRAWKVLEELEAHATGGEPRDWPGQLSLFSAQAAAAEAIEPEPLPPHPHPAVVELEGIDVNGITPVQALNLLARLQEISRESSAKLI